MVGLATVSSLAQAIKTLFLRAAQTGFQIDGFLSIFHLELIWPPMSNNADSFWIILVDSNCKRTRV